MSNLLTKACCTATVVVFSILTPVAHAEKPVCPAECLDNMNDLITSVNFQGCTMYVGSPEILIVEGAFTGGLNQIAVRNNTEGFLICTKNNGVGGANVVPLSHAEYSQCAYAFRNACGAILNIVPLNQQ